MSKRMMKRYLADGVYGAYDPDLRSIALTTEDGVRVNDTIFVDQDVLEQLEDYAAALRDQGLMPRRGRARAVPAELLGQLTESTEVYATIRETLRAHVAEMEMTPARPDVDGRIEAATKAVAKALYQVPAHSRVAAELGEKLDAEDREHRDTVEAYNRASVALSSAGVPHDVDTRDPLEQLAARVRWLQHRRPVVPLTRGDAIGTARLAIAKALGDGKHGTDALAEIVVDALGVGA